MKFAHVKEKEEGVGGNGRDGKEGVGGEIWGGSLEQQNQELYVYTLIRLTVCMKYYQKDGMHAMEAMGVRVPYINTVAEEEGQLAVGSIHFLIQCVCHVAGLG